MFCLSKWVTKTSHPSRDWRVDRPQDLIHHRGILFSSLQWTPLEPPPHSSPPSKALRNQPNTSRICNEWGGVATPLFLLQPWKIPLKYFIWSGIWPQAHSILCSHFLLCSLLKWILTLEAQKDVQNRAQGYTNLYFINSINSIFSEWPVFFLPSSKKTVKGTFGDIPFV